VVDELLGNALAYARSQVSVTLARRGGATVLIVEDDGPGIPDDERELVFDRFRRGTSSVPGGSGLGLALVRETVASWGGSVRAGESPAGGLAIVCTIPA
jgi:signal transduction histidine kinase